MPSDLFTKKNLSILISMISVLALIMGVMVYFLQKPVDHSRSKKDQSKKIIAVKHLDLGQMNVSFMEKSNFGQLKKNGYCILGITILIPKDYPDEHFHIHQYALRDALLSILMSKKNSDLYSPEKDSAHNIKQIANLKKEIKQKFNRIIRTHKVRQIIFSDFLVN